MGTIIEFRRPETPESAPANELASEGRGGSHTAEIIIFPGVRIERHSPAEQYLNASKTAAGAKGPAGTDH